ncbi:MAG: PH domain-containing protein [Xanthomonadales bacterium]|nr:PH domain-containing protein [Xanthomonadales bacterium]MBP7416996.1 PH domain-containing protein [Xanthomonadales bacterium]MBP8176797.1 PH domain-containing protein [Xanthomonadales bacterium]
MATTPSEPGATPPPVAFEGRLHPFSWMFVLLTQLRQVALPLVFLLFFGRGEWWELFALVGAGALALYSLIYSFGFRYRIGAGELVVREGILNRTERHIPFARIQNMVRKRNLLHRLFDVTELRLESAGGARPEAVMSVIRLPEADRLEAILRGHGGTGDADATVAEEPPLLELGSGEIVRLGLVTNRGMVVIGALFALYYQMAPSERGALRGLFRGVYGMFESWSHAIAGTAARVATLAVALVFFVLLLKLLSVAMAFLSFHGFQLRRHGERVRTEGGLITRHAASARREKVQRLLYGESWLARRMGRRWLSCEVAGGQAAVNEAEGGRLRWLVPIGTPAEVRRIARELAPGLDPEDLAWRPLHPRTFWRRLRMAALAWSVPFAALTLAFGPMLLLPWLGVLVYSAFEARGEARFGAYAIDDEVVAYRSGWLSRQWLVARIEKGQSLSLSASPFDRRAGMASVSIDTAGAAAAASRFRIPYLAEADARVLLEHLRARIDGPPPRPPLDAQVSVPAQAV